MKNKSQTVRAAFWVLLGVAILVSSLALNRPLSATQNETATLTPQADTIVTTAEAVEEVGSTDGIIFMASIIVLIIISPILLKRKAWSNGKGKK